MSEALMGRRLVVVGASSGVGEAVAVRAVGAGADVVLVGRRQDRLDKAVSEAGGGSAVAADITEPASCLALVERAVEVLGAIDALLFCAGVSALSALRDTPAEEWRRILDTNVVGPSVVTAAAIDHLAPGAIVGFVSSESVGRPRHGLVPYSASKAALEESIRGWREEHPEIRFCCVRIGATEGTEFARDFDMDAAMALFPDWIAHGHLPAKFMPVDQVAASIVDVLGTALANPAVDLQDVTLRPPGPLMQGPIEPLLTAVDEQQDSAGS